MKHNQILQAKYINKQIMLTNGVEIITIPEVRKCKRRVMNESIEYITRFDLIYSGNENLAKNALHEAKSKSASVGGKKCQEKHGDLIKKNLNTGIPWNKDTQGNYPYSFPCTKQTREKISKANSGKHNGMYGKKMSEFDKSYRSELMKNKIKNGEFTPNSNNRNTHWDSHYDGNKYRSSWEALYHASDQAAEYETLRIPYNINGVERIYIVDFVNHSTKKAIEVKPKSQLQNCYEKIEALKEWCYNNNYEMIIADEDYLQKIDKTKINFSLFDEKTLTKIGNIR